MVSDLTGLEIANASLLDESTACAEAMTMAQRVSKSKKMAFFVDRDCHPQNIAVIKTRAEPLGIEVIVGNPDKLDPEQVFGAIFHIPAPMAMCAISPITSPSCMSIRPSASWWPTRWR